MGGHRLHALLLAAVLVTAVGCSADESPRPPTPTPSASSATPTASVVEAWQAADVQVRPNWVGRDAPWLWEYSDDIVVIGPRELVALDRETGAEVWRVPFGRRVCGATRTPSALGLVAVTVGRCSADTAARRTTVKVVDLESASVVWQRPVLGSPLLDIGGDVLVASAGCGARRFALSTGDALGRIDAGCSDRVVIGQGMVVVSSAEPHRWRAIDVASGSVVADLERPAAMPVPQRILTRSPLTALARPAVGKRFELVRFDADELRVLSKLSAASVTGFFAWSGDSLVLADQDLPGATEFSVDDGSSLGGFPGVPTARWIPFDLYGDGVLGFEEGGRLTLRSLRDGSVTTLGRIGDTDLDTSGRMAVVIEGTLLVPGKANAQVLAYTVTVP